MTTYNQLKKEFEDKVVKLQATCKHKNLTSWSEEWWAIGHSTGYSVRHCKDCNKQTHKKEWTVK